ncbi:uncharacterized protein LOC125647486 [Ostrea edulis]|uniref:uncharacterized protein LOC125647486 n=1 Tax=Ostrea edulis TaxID=37623 RepID=UPI0024AF125C|nr:uncharacterized protein LOC125647486 [Ostrea edulis]
MHWILLPEPRVPRTSIPIVEDLISSQEFVTEDNPITWLKQKSLIDDQQTQQIASLTTGQKDNCMWSSVRKNRLTASNVLAAIKRNRYHISLYKRLCSAYDLSKKDAINWGICNDRSAVELCKTFGDTVVEPTGVMRLITVRYLHLAWLHHNGVLGSSSDGIIRRPAAFGFHHQDPSLDNIKPEVLEVKCPFSAKDMTILGAIERIRDFYLEIQDFCGVKTEVERKPPLL